MSASDDMRDVLIVGGGLVGASLAIALDGAGLRVTLVEAVTPHTNADARYDERHLALARATVNALESLAVLDGATRAEPVRCIHVTRQGDFGSVRLDAEALGLPPFGAVVPARELGNALLRRTERCAALERIAPAKAIAIDPGPEAVAVTLRSGASTRLLRTRVLVGADGTESFVRAASGIGMTRHDYRQSALVTTLMLEQPLDSTAHERFSADGLVALLPLGDRRAGLVMTVANDQAETIAQSSDAAFLDVVHRRFGWRLGRFDRPGRRTFYPLRRAIADRATAPRTVLIGNAAQTVHPLGAQGFNLGLRDALSLAELLRETACAGGDLGSAALLAAYVARRAPDRAATIEFAHGVLGVTASDALPMRLARALGLHALDRLPSLQRRFALRGMGFRGDTSHWALGA